VRETRRHDRDRDPGTEHLGGHEMAEIVQAEVIQSCALAGGDELLGDPVRLPRLEPAESCVNTKASSTPWGQFDATSSKRAHNSCRVAGSSATRWDRRVLVGVSTGPSGPSTKARWKDTLARWKSMSTHRNARSWPRRAPVTAARTRNR
jgi:hypothetical protein